LLLDYVSIWLLPTRSPLEQQFPVQIFRKPEPYVMFGGTPLVDFQTEAEDGTIISEQLNRLGYRGPAPVSPKRAGEYRIFVLGGSTVFLGNPPIPVLLEEMFKHNGFAQVRVYNFGVISSNSGMELARIVFEISELEPDLVVMYNGGNDIIGPYRQDPRPGYPFNFLVYENNPLLESDIRDYPTLALAAYGSNLARYFFPDYFLNEFSTFSQLHEEVKWGSAEWQAAIAEAYVNNLVKAAQISQAFGSDFIAFPQPILYFKKTPAAEEADLAGNWQRRDHSLAVRQAIRSKIEAAEILADVKIVDLSDIYNDTAEWVFTDSIHIRQESSVVVVQAMYEAMTVHFGHKFQDSK
jgi:lysophospholipase L1-like esterase